MKNYKLLVPIALIALFVLSAYMLYSTKHDEQVEYERYLTEAREFRAQGIQVDADRCYKEALNLKPSLALTLEIGEFYREVGRNDMAVGWGEEMLEVYPKEPALYEAQLDVLLAQQDYIACFQLRNQFHKRKLTSQRFEEMLKPVEYTFYYNGGYDQVTAFCGGLCGVAQEEGWGYVDERGDQTADYQFTQVGPFVDGLAPVADQTGQEYYIDREGNKKKVILLEPTLHNLGLMADGKFPAYDGSSWGIYTEDALVFGGFDEISSAGNGVVAGREGNEWRLYSPEGEDLTGKSYDGVVMDERGLVARNDRIFVYTNGAYQMIDTAGNVIAGPYEEAKVFADTTLAAVRKGGNWGFVDVDGNLKLEPKYELARSFSHGLAAVRFAGKWGYIDLDGNMVIQPQFEDAKDFTASGSAFVLKDGKWRLLRLYKDNY